MLLQEVLCNQTTRFEFETTLGELSGSCSKLTPTSQSGFSQLKLHSNPDVSKRAEISYDLGMQSHTLSLRQDTTTSDCSCVTQTSYYIVTTPTVVNVTFPHSVKRHAGRAASGQGGRRGGKAAVQRPHACDRGHRDAVASPGVAGNPCVTLHVCRATSMSAPSGSLHHIPLHRTPCTQNSLMHVSRSG